MNFMHKCRLHNFLSRVPRGEKLTFFFQKYVTKSLPVSNEKFLKKIATAKEHFDIFTKYSQSENNKNVNYYEFGAGWDLINPIGLSLLGMQTLKCIDIRKLVFPSLLNDTISKLYLLKEKIPFDFSLPESIPSVTTSNFRSVLMEYFRIDYQAPLDAMDTNIQDSTIDFIASNVTFGHIPTHDIGSILRECHRVLKQNGLIRIV